MAVWTTIREFYDKLTAHTGYWGRAWVAILFTLRLFAVVTVGTSVYGDDLSAFRCDTQQPGCSNTCFNHFSPISHIRLLAFQIIFVMMPFVTFYFITERWRDAIKDAENETKQYPQEIRKQNSGKDDLIEQSKANQIELAISKRENLMKRVQIAYIFASAVTIIVEMIFIYLLLWVQLEAHITMNVEDYKIRVTHFFPPLSVLNNYLGKILYVPEYYKCRHPMLRKILGDETYPYISPCSQGKEVPCYVARAKEKTLFIHYIFMTSLLGLLLICCETIKKLYKLTTQTKVYRRIFHTKTLTQNNIRDIVGTSVRTEVLKHQKYIREDIIPNVFEGIDRDIQQDIWNRQKEDLEALEPEKKMEFLTKYFEATSNYTLSGPIVRPRTFENASPANRQSQNGFTNPIALNQDQPNGTNSLPQFHTEPSTLGRNTFSSSQIGTQRLDYQNPVAIYTNNTLSQNQTSDSYGTSAEKQNPFSHQNSRVDQKTYLQQPLPNSGHSPAHSINNPNLGVGSAYSNRGTVRQGKDKKISIIKNQLDSDNESTSRCSALSANVSRRSGNRPLNNCKPKSSSETINQNNNQLRNDIRLTEGPVVRGPSVAMTKNRNTNANNNNNNNNFSGGFERSPLLAPGPRKKKLGRNQSINAEGYN